MEGVTAARERLDSLAGEAVTALLCAMPGLYRNAYARVAGTLEGRETEKRCVIRRTVGGGKPPFSREYRRKTAYARRGLVRCRQPLRPLIQRRMARQLASRLITNSTTTLNSVQ